ncbi:hypothetical protein SAMN02982989_0657 [Xaviernesmea oryzae]|jgi:Dimethyladenosine transferase (rRNA methylation)|uniref:Methyltransferase domain-containing protein n=1 Tax=Xaviernesmea oryzae TaxID=464029 RepID=A0A1X7FSF2_9HYPH|nr:class I SAM-dependent methyltransferase [Xaviernesmea oryzae]SMF57907.1 hypothetical protein SAMN02982989_0657 [Xaviernesmea oryzae]
MESVVNEPSWVGRVAAKQGKSINPHGGDFLSRLFFFERDVRNKIRFGVSAPASASLIYVNPSRITKAIHALDAMRIESGRVKSGDWDTHTRELKTVKKIKGVRQHIVRGIPWEQTSAWRQCLQYLERGHGSDGINSLDDIVERYKKLDKFIALVRRDREAAFKTRQQIKPGNFREAAGILVNIDREGDLLFGMRGCHRLAVAQSLNLRCIPVQLGIVHADAVRNGTWRKNILEPAVVDYLINEAKIEAKINRRKVKAAAAVAASAPQPTAASPGTPTKQRYTGRTMAQSIEFDANKDAHWNGQPVPKFERLVPIMPGSSLVEIGAAEGILSLTLAPHKERVRAIDITPNRHQKALELKARWLELGKRVENCEMVLGDALKNPELISGFDTLMASRVIYYFGTFLEEFMDNVRKNVDNVCFIGNPVRTAQFNQGKTGKLGEYAKYATIPGMIELVERHGFKVTHVDETLDPLIIARKL